MDLSDQVLTVYENDLPVHTTLVAQIEGLRDTGTIVHIWGQVTAGLLDWTATQIHVEHLEIATQAPAVPAGYEEWKPYVNAVFGYGLLYPGDSQVVGADLNQSIQFSGPLLEGQLFHALILHPGDQENETLYDQFLQGLTSLDVK